MTDNRTGLDIKDIDILEAPQCYIYVLRNSVGKIKIGMTTNIKQRIESLSGSNGQGNKILECYCSEPTYLYTLERIMHEKMGKLRIKGTEWFYSKNDPSGCKLFNNAVKGLSELMSTHEYKVANNLRKERSKKCQKSFIEKAD